MILRSSGFLGLALGDRSITCTELAVSGDRRSVRRMAVFTFSPDLSLDKAAATGQALATFLRQQRFRASRAVVGVPARWLIAAERDVPPAGQEQLRSMLRLEAERLSVSESGEMVFDYIGRPDPAHGGKVLLVGILRQQLDRIEALLEAAGIRVAAVTPASLALASGLQEEQDQPMLILGRQGAELVWQHNGTPRMLRHVAMVAADGQGAPVLGSLGSELRRAVTLAPTNGSGPPRELLLWDGVGLSEQQVSELANRLGVSVRSGRGLALLGIQTEEPTDTEKDAVLPDQFAPALALALAGAERRTLQLDFKHSCLTPPRRKPFDRRAAWAITLGVMVVVAVITLFWNVRRRQAELDEMQAQLSGMSGDVKSAEQMLGRVAYARGFFDARPPILECLREITLAFRDEEPIWVTSFTLRETGKGQLMGKATDQRTILAFCNRLQSNKRFGDVRTLQMTEVSGAGGKSKEQSFTIGFTFVGLE